MIHKVSFVTRKTGPMLLTRTPSLLYISTARTVILQLLNYKCNCGGLAFRYAVLELVVLCSFVLAIPARTQQQPEPEDPEDEKQVGLWLDQGISTPFQAINLSTSGSMRESVQPFESRGSLSACLFAFSGPLVRS